jgi:hypothetical protein
MMNDDQFIEGFEACTLPASEFHHEQHIRVVWLYLGRHSLLDTLVRFSAGLRRFATANGKPNLYHETITWAFVFLIHRRMQHQMHEQSWPQFVEANADLLNWRDNILKGYYRDDTLKSETARRTFVFPDRVPLGPAVANNNSVNRIHRRV